MNTIAYKLIVSVLMLLCLGLAQAADSVGQITHLSGVVSAKRADGTSKVLSLKSDVLPGDTLSTQQDTYARIKFKDNSEVVLRPGTDFKIEKFAFNEAEPESDNALFGLLKGGFRAVTGLLGHRNHDKVSFQTPTATIGIRGTQVGVLFCNDDCGGVQTASGNVPANGVHVDVTSGAVNVSNSAGQQTVQAGQFAYVANANTAPVLKPPQEGVQVTMPTSISNNKGTGKGGTNCTYQ